MDTESKYKENAFLLQIRNKFKTDLLRLIFSVVASMITDLNFTVEQKTQRQHWFLFAVQGALALLAFTDRCPFSYLQHFLLT